MAPKITLLGKRFGRLITIERIPKKKLNGRVGYICQCDCGNKKYVQDSNLVSETTTSCGCLRKEYLATRYDKKDTRLNEMYRYYRRNDKVAKREFSLSKVEFRKVAEESCNYCGIQGNPFN